METVAGGRIDGGTAFWTHKLAQSHVTDISPFRVFPANPFFFLSANNGGMWDVGHQQEDERYQRTE